MKTYLIVLVLLFAGAAGAAPAEDSCTDAAGVQNRFYVKVTSISLEGAKCGAEWRIRGINYVGDLYGVFEFWKRRGFEVPHNTPALVCQWGDPDSCRLVPGPSYKAVHLGDVVYFDAKKKVGHPVDPRVLISAVVILKGVE